VASLSRRQDDLAQMALRSLLQVIRFHFQDVYLKGSKTDRSDDNGATRAFSEREKRLLVEFLASSLHESLNIQRLADLLGMTVQQLIQGFKASFGTTPWQHVLRMRLAEGLRLLQHSDITVAQIAVATGFFSSSHFATACTKHFGISPSGYRRLSRGLARR